MRYPSMVSFKEGKALSYIQSKAILDGFRLIVYGKELIHRFEKAQLLLAKLSDELKRENVSALFVRAGNQRQS